jgi:hypothetical protein
MRPVLALRASWPVPDSYSELWKMPHTGSSLEIGILIGKKLGRVRFCCAARSAVAKTESGPLGSTRLNLTTPKI